eukprot:TRINITY_DN43070_c0_g1_i1.p1 TRINITY_DN43070_c0_g1~~TRINITY_DN43070_c0_g1_i1.p1  ORF type:complete len:165 (+),score=49.90 TRINITY_DN43070_c0_g1_i1:144-638(+)
MSFAWAFLLLLQLFPFAAAIAPAVKAPTRPLAAIEQMKQLSGYDDDDPYMTDEERIAKAKRILEQVKDRLEKAQMRDMTKKQYCDKESKAIDENLKETQVALEKDQADYQKALYDVRKCGCCCDDHAKFALAKISAEDDVTFQSNRIKILNKQAVALDNWCSVG